MSASGLATFRIASIRRNTGSKAASNCLSATALGYDRDSLSMNSKTKAAQGITRKFLANVVPGLVKPIHSLWNEVIGFLFLVLGVLAIRPIWQAWRDEDFTKLALSGFFSLVMISFGIHGFWKARRISRS